MSEQQAAFALGATVTSVRGMFTGAVGVVVGESRQEFTDDPGPRQRVEWQSAAKVTTTPLVSDLRPVDPLVDPRDAEIAELRAELKRTRDEIRRLVDKVDAITPNRTLIADLRQIANGGKAEWTL
jgi:hypothetical protein